MFDYIRDPQVIYDQSFATIRAETDLDALAPDIATVAVRLIHACGMTDICDDLSYSDDVVSSVKSALAAGKPVITDVRMVAEGIIRNRLPSDNVVICTLNDASVSDHARTTRNTRSAAAVDLWGDNLAGAVVAIGNAPTALFRLLEILHQGAPKPAAILGFPVGFVGAVESKDALIERAGDVPYMTLRGRRGGSAMAAAAVNAMAGEPA
ncbi:MAG: precorrin-8X methylmutase [Rhodospirillales bacterium]|jgi:precorrin-8X/cobalt-precorrin-8 methylmutase|nr:precorrin-8X methylmutase [Rhodospirillales bacterium]MBT4039083.1 precorrin-8X methylmutase [Rhodospirillales bacterium]MBT4625484.1 precorrin-8X methylmutase [Rhodospirillales bacterium]MBT5352122.1 precorrin-8X methylmutase [Rhodospirillales bacterium]MBT5521891.1 precorrin-8X methylmutase [Rhodospirillales bacterium]